MFDKQTIKNALSEKGLGEEELLQGIKEKEAAGQTFSRVKMRRMVILAAVVSVLLLSCTFLPAIKRQFNIYYTPDEELTFIEIYTAEDLDAVRNDMGANYRLMNDIVFTDEDYAKGGRFEGGFVPIGATWREGNSICVDSFGGIFDGNGYTIYNLQINAEGKECVGLFAHVWSNPFDGFDTIGVITNLRLYGGSVVAKDADIVGSVAGYGSYVIRCAVEDFTVTVLETEKSTVVGGVVGYADLIDSCYADVTVSGGSCRGQIAGKATAIVTSVATSNEPLCGAYRMLPNLMSEAIFERLIEELPEAKKNYIKVFYNHVDQSWIDSLKDSSITLDGVREVFSENLVSSLEAGDSFYWMCGNVVPKELSRMESSIIECVGEEVVAQIFEEEGFYKRGSLYNYTITEGETYEGFDFDEIWVMKDGKPVLRVFEDE